MLRLPLFLLSLLGAVPLVSSSTAQTPSPTTGAKLRRLLPFPEETLRQKMNLSIGFGKWLGGDCRFNRYGNGDDDYAADSVAVRRALTGGISDAPRYLTLGGLYRRADLPEKSGAAYGESETICRNVLSRNPHDGYALAEYGRTLAAMRQPGLAETYLKHAAMLAPNSADVQLALGSVSVMQAAPGTRAGRLFLRDAAAAYDRAVSLTPQNPAVWTARADFRASTLPRLLGKPLSYAGLSDYEEAAALAPNDVDAQIQVPDMESLVFETTHHFYTSPEAAKAEPRSFDLRAKEALRRLTKIARSTHGKKSASAYDARAWVQFEYFYDPAGTQKSLRLALLENLNDEGARDYQKHVAAVNGDYALLAAFCRRELVVHSEVRPRVLLAYADYYLAQQKPKYWREGLAQMELAHAAQPQDYADALGLAVFLLEAGQTPRANVLLNKIAPQAQKHSKEQQTEYDLTRGVGAALAGQEQDAQAFFSLARKNNPKNQPASALALLPTASAGALPQPHPK